MPSRRSAAAAAAVVLLSSSSFPSTCDGAKVFLPRVAHQQQLLITPKGSQTPASLNAIIVAEEGHSASATADNICTQLSSDYDLGSFSPICRESIAASVRAERGLAMQHTPEYTAAVTALETHLGDLGHNAKEFETTMYQRPYKANFLARLYQGGGGGGGGGGAAAGGASSSSSAASASPLTLCEIGFGAGHGAALFFAHARNPSSIVYAFDHGLARYTIPAHDFLDAVHPSRLALMLGDSAVTAGQLRSYYPDARCDVVYVDGSGTYAGTKTDISNFASLVGGPDHVLVVANGGAATESGRAWRDAVAEGLVAWEGTLLESTDRPDGDSLVFGRYNLGAKTGGGGLESASISPQP